MKDSVRVRFAPSPTGYLHIGGARTALFNYLFARHHNGQFLLRIEDTDVIRSKDEVIQQILDSICWLGLDWDEEPVYQSNRIHRYQEVCQKLLDLRMAYYCFCTQKELDEKRQVARKKKSEYQYDRKCLKLSEKNIREKLSKNIPKTVRFYVPDGQTTIQDMIHGLITVQNSEIDDFILLRSDGQPVYHLAVVVDDHDISITHVIRGDDHLSNTPKQILLYNALKWNVPLFAHVPLILGPDQKRLSKRHGAVSVEVYKEKGYFPETLLNFIVLLGWAPKDNEEILSLKDLIERFSIKGINKKSAVFDEQKLLWMNGVYMRSKKPEDLCHTVLDVLRSHHLIDENWDKQDIIQFIHMMKNRVRTVQEFALKGEYFFKDPIEYEAKGVDQYWNEKSIFDLLDILKSRFESLRVWSVSSIEKCIRGLAEELNLKAGEIMHPTRLALTGLTASPGLFELITFLGQETVVRRMENAIQYIKLSISN